MKHLFRIMTLLAVMASVAACSNMNFKRNDGDNQPPPSDNTAIQEGGGMDVNSLDDPNSRLSQRVVYFELDSSQVSAEDRELIMAHAEFLAQNPQVSVVLEGHADERGSREYNIALGERRAKAVQQLMLVQGVAEKQLQVISFGEERPVALGHDESAWRLNRRVELLYSGY